MICLCLFPIVVDWCQWDIIVRIAERFNGLIAGAFHYFVTFIQIVIFIIFVVWNIKFIKGNYKNLKITAFLPTIIFILVVVLRFFLPLTDMYVDFNFRLNRQKREEIICMLEGKEVMQLRQTNEDTYLLPINLRSTSQNAKVIYDRENDTLKVLFYVHRGLSKNSAIIYISDDSSPKDGDFGLKYVKIRHITPHWYSVTH